MGVQFFRPKNWTQKLDARFWVPPGEKLDAETDKNWTPVVWGPRASRDPWGGPGNRICGHQVCRFFWCWLKTKTAFRQELPAFLKIFLVGPLRHLGDHLPLFLPLALRLRSARPAGICFTRGWGPMTEDTTIKLLSQANPPEPIFCSGGRFLVRWGCLGLFV